MYRPKDTQERILHRLKISAGHLQKVISMVESNQYCIDVIHQSQAVQRALQEADALVLENHLNSCVSDAIKKGRQKEAIGEIMSIFDKKARR